MFVFSENKFDRFNDNCSLLNISTSMIHTFKQLFDSTPDPVMLPEGIDDPGVLKCVFMAGGPGSGKSYTASDIFDIPTNVRTSFGSMGLKLVSSDVIFEIMLKQAGIDPNSLADIERDNPTLWHMIANAEGGVRDRAKTLSLTQLKQYQNGRLGVIIDGTGDKFEKIALNKRRFEDLGYDCMLVFVDAPLELALQRNRQRSRTLPDAIVREIWHLVQRNLNHFRHAFGSRFVVVDSTARGLDEADIRPKIRAFLREPVSNPIGREWLRVMGGTHRQRRSAH